MSVLQPFWDTAVQRWDVAWAEYAPYFGLPASESDRLLFALFSTTAINGTFWIANFFLYWIYRFDLFAQYKLAPGVWPDRALVKKNFIHILISDFVVRPVVLYLLYRPFRYFGTPLATAPIPPGHVILLQFAVCIAVNDTLFYWLHRLLHHRLIYKYIHKQHHEYKVNVGIASEYVHPIEDILSSSLPTIAGCLFMGVHPAVLCLWLVLRLLETVDAHCGYDFPFSPFCLFPSIQGGAPRHDFHHSHNVGSYGSFFAFWDRVMGTDKEYKEYRAKTLQAKNKVQ